MTPSAIASLRFDGRATLLVGTALALMFSAGLGAGWMLERYDAGIGFGREAARIAEVLELARGKSVGDIRAGTGRWTVDMARRVGPEGQAFATVGPDPAHVLMATVADSGLDNVTVITRTPADAPRLPLACCDAVLLRRVYSDLQRERPGFLETLKRVTRPGALVAVIEFHPDAPTGPPRHTLPRREVIAEFTAAGFALVRTTSGGSGTITAWWCRRSTDYSRR
jgi:ubiquinone/menaquinone biosynthesis C-methylase UbiE